MGSALRQSVLIVSLCYACGVFSSSSVTRAAGNVVMALDGMIVNNSGGGQTGWGGFGRFSYGDTFTVGTPTTPGLGRYDAFTISETGGDASAGGGVGVNFTIGNINSPVDSALGPIEPVTANMFPLVDLATFGANFNPEEYVAELVYKPLEGNTATQLNMTLDTADGFTDGGLRRGEQWQWGFFDLVNTYNNTQTNGDLDTDGFAVVQSNMGILSEAASNFNGASFMYATAPLPAGQEGDALPDFNAFEGGPLPVPNGAVQIHLQAVFGGDQQPLVDNWEIKALRIRKISPDPTEVARLDGKSGFSLRFGSPFERNPDTFINIDGVDYDPLATDQLIRFNESGFLPNDSFIINTDDAGTGGASGFGVWQSASSTIFDATDATIEITARLTAPLETGEGFADQISVVAKDKDGNGTAEAGDFGGEEYHFAVDLNQFNESSMTTISMPFSAASIEQAQEFAIAGDGDLTDFNLYYLGVLLNQNEALVDLEIESIRILLPAPPGVAGDYNNDGTVNAADYTLWRDNLGANIALDNEVVTPGMVTSEDYDEWKARFGNTGGAGALAGDGAVPEPSTWALILLTMAVMGVFRRQVR